MSNKKIVIAGAGFAGLYTAINLSKALKNRDSQITLVDQNNYFLFTPLLHEVATGNLNREQVITPIRQITNKYNIDFVNDKITKININDNKITTTNSNLNYDYLVIALGSKNNDDFATKESVFHLKTIKDATEIKNSIISKFEELSIKNTSYKIKISVIGAGPTGVELVAEISEFCNSIKHFLKCKKIDFQVTLISNIDTILSNFDKKSQGRTLNILKRKNIEILLDTNIIQIDKNTLISDDNKKIHSDITISTVGVSANKININDKIHKDDRDRLYTTNNLNLKEYPNVFVAGDMSAGYPMDAQLAVKQAKHITENIENLISNNELKPFIYKPMGKLVSLGSRYALGEVNGKTFSGRYVWFIWRTVYLSKMILWSKKISVATNWTINLFSSRDLTKID